MDVEYLGTEKLIKSSRRMRFLSHFPEVFLLPCDSDGVWFESRLFYMCADCHKKDRPSREMVTPYRDKPAHPGRLRLV